QANCDHRDACEQEPPAFEECGPYSKCNGGTLVIPKAVVVRRDHAKCVLAWPQVRVKRLAPGTRVTPILVYAIDPVAKLHPFRRTEAGGSVSNLNVPLARWKRSAVISLKHNPARGNRANEDVRELLVRPYALGVDHGQAAVGTKPEQ